MKRTGLQRKTAMKRKRATPRTPKLVVRLTGAALLKLRRDCWERDGGRCQECLGPTYWQARFDGDPLAYEMAHIHAKRNGGDTLDNVRTLCAFDHRAEHAGKLARPL